MKKILASLILSLFIISGLWNTINSVYAWDELDAILNTLSDDAGTTAPTTTTDMSMWGDDLDIDYWDGTSGGYDTKKDVNWIYKSLSRILGWEIFYKTALPISFFLTNNEDLKNTFGTAERFSFISGELDNWTKINTKQIFEKLWMVNKMAILLWMTFLGIFFYYLIIHLDIVSVWKNENKGNDRRRDDDFWRTPDQQRWTWNGMSKITFLSFLAKLNEVRNNEEVEETTKKIAQYLFWGAIIMSFVVIQTIAFSYSNIIDFDRAWKLPLFGFIIISIIVLGLFMGNMIAYEKMVIWGIAKKYYSSDEDIDFTREIIVLLGKAIFFNIILFGFSFAYVIGMLVDIFLL